MLRHGQLADIVQQRRGAKRTQLRIAQIELFADLHGVDLHAAKVAVCGVVLGFDGQRQRFNRAQVQARHVFHVLLLIFQPAQV